MSEATHTLSKILSDRVSDLVKNNIILYYSSMGSNRCKHMYLNNFSGATPEEELELDQQYTAAHDDGYIPEEEQPPLIEFRENYARNSNPMFINRTSYDCNTCLRYIATVSRLVYLDNAKTVSVLEGLDIPSPYDIPLAAIMSGTTTLPIGSICTINNGVEFIESNVVEYPGVEEDDKPTKVTFNHFSIDVDVFRPQQEISTVVNDITTGVSHIVKDLAEYTSAYEAVKKLVDSNWLTKSNSYKDTISRYKTIIDTCQVVAAKYSDLAVKDPYGKYLIIQAIISTIYKDGGISALKKAIFTNPMAKLVRNIAEGGDEDISIAKYEHMVDPENHGVSKSGPSAKQLAAAIESIDKHGLRASLGRRLAVLDDLTVADVVYIDEDSRSLMDDPLAQAISEKIVHTPIDPPTSATEISLDELLEKVKDASMLEIYTAPEINTRVVNLVAPIDDKAKYLTKWGNPFTQTYVGNRADALHRAVVDAGGKIDGPLGASIAWYNTDDYDVHYEDSNQRTINFDSRGTRKDGDDILDIDANASDPYTEKPIENINFDDSFEFVKEGVFIFFIHNYTRRDKKDTTCDISVRIFGEHRTMRLKRQLGNKDKTIIATVKMKDGEVEKITYGTDMVLDVISDSISVQMKNWLPVNLICYSPNHWESGTKAGPKHTMFMSNSIKVKSSVRGFHTSQLSNRLYTHRRSLQALSDKMMCQITDEQLAGYGFSDDTRAADQTRVYFRLTTNNRKDVFSVKM